MSRLIETEYGAVLEGWNFVPANEYCLKVTDGTHDSPKQQETGRYLITSRHIKGRNIDFDNAYLISEEEFHKINQRSKVDQWDVIISMIGEYCGFSYVERNQVVNYAVKNVGIFKTGDRTKSLWLHYYIQSEIGKNILDGLRGGSSQPYISLGSLRGFPVLVPDIVTEQEKIISVLCSLDDKIDLLHRQNKTLEAMAETLFRQWFVEGAGDWEVGKVEDLFVLQRGFDLPVQNRTSGKFPIFASSGLSGYHEEYKVKAPGITTGRSGVLGNVFLVLEDFWPLNTSLYIKEFKLATPLYAYFVLKNLDLNSFNAGSAVPTLNRNHVHEESILIPPKDLILEFDRMASPLYLKIKQNESQITTLEKMRDGLLPKLMSGEVRVEHA